MPKSEGSPSHLERVTHGLARWSASGSGLLTAIASVMVWLAVGNWLHYSLQWENSFNAYIGIITFLMIFVTQRSQRKEILALHVKLNELVATSKEADNAVINIEALTEDEIVRAKETRDELAEGET